MSRIAIWTANTGLFVLCCYLVAGIINTAADEWLAGDPTAALPAPVARADAPRAVADRQVIVERNLFNVSTLLQPVPGVGEIEEDLEATKLPLRLLGTAASSETDLSWAAVEDLESQRHVVVKLKDVLQQKATVVAIERRRIVLDHAGRHEELALEDQQDGAARPAAAGRRAPSAAAARQTPADIGARLRQLTQNRGVPDPAEVEVAGRSAAEIFSSARILPKYESGQMVGIQLNAVKPGSLFENMGIQNGDTITQVNGITIDSPQGSAEVLRELTESERFELVIKGADGNQRTLTYDVEEE
jgi:general secretion pathway protein C